MVIFRNIGELLTLEGAGRRQARRPTEDDLSPIEKGAFVVEKGFLKWVGPEKRLPKEFSKGQKKAREVDLKGKCVLPGFVESHTHLVFAGDRQNEFELRNKGVSYQEIAAAGGGIRSTVRATRQATSAQLLRSAQARADVFVSQGVTTLEIKSGYGLDWKNEQKILKVARQLEGPRIVPTYLGPHAVPAEHKNSESYLQEVLEVHLPALKRAGLADRLDMFVEQGYFSLEQATRYLTAAKQMGFAVTFHADQITRTGASEVGARLGAHSVDHAIQVNDSDIQELADSEATAVLLPVADFYLKCAYPPARKMIDQGCRVALATDFNPGTSPSQSLSLVGVLARLEMKMSLAEVIVAYTLGGAYALGLESSVGSLEVGKSADFICVDQDWRHLFYQVGHHPVSQTWVAGRNLKIS